jgi:hypothetical protein
MLNIFIFLIISEFDYGPHVSSRPCPAGKRHWVQNAATGNLREEAQDVF